MDTIFRKYIFLLIGLFILANVIGFVMPILDYPEYKYQSKVLLIYDFISNILILILLFFDAKKYNLKGGLINAIIVFAFFDSNLAIIAFLMYCFRYLPEKSN